VKSRNSLKSNTVLNGAACCSGTISAISKLTNVRKCVWWHLSGGRDIYCRLLVPCVGSWFTLTGTFHRSRHTVINTLYFLLFQFTGRRDSRSFHWFLIPDNAQFVPSTYPRIWQIYLEWMKAISLFSICVSLPRDDNWGKSTWWTKLISCCFGVIHSLQSDTLPFSKPTPAQHSSHSISVLYLLRHVSLPVRRW
jgi:hypothetical protein